MELENKTFCSPLIEGKGKYNFPCTDRSFRGETCRRKCWPQLTHLAAVLSKSGLGYDGANMRKSSKLFRVEACRRRYCPHMAEKNRVGKKLRNWPVHDKVCAIRAEIINKHRR